MSRPPAVSCYSGRGLLSHLPTAGSAWHKGKVRQVLPGVTGFRQLQEWGYPMGAPRSVPPADKAFSVIHITGNSRLPSAEGELAWRINDPGLQNSATFFVNRDGTIWQGLGDPLHMDPWSNGDINRPDLTNPRIAAVVRDGVNANQRTLVAIENVGYEPGSPITAAQEKACARIIAYYHAVAKVPVNRQTVIGHYQINSVTRANCPGTDKRLIDRIVALATQTEEPAMPANLPPPATWHPLKGHVELKGTYNAFQYTGMAGGEPVLVRLNDLLFNGTSALVIARAHWNADVAEASCFLVSPHAYLPRYGWREDVWWSKSPLPEPKYITDEADDTDTAVVKAAADVELEQLMVATGLARKRISEL